jgi:hypothetical protein
MADLLRIDLTADRGLAYIETITRVGVDYTGASFRMQVRQNPDVGGTPLVNLATVTTNAEGLKLMYAGSATVGAHITAGRLTADMYNYVNSATNAKYVSGDTVTVSQVRILIDNSTMNTLPYPEERGDDLTLAYDLLVTLSGASESKDYYGIFKVRGTVTQ